MLNKPAKQYMKLAEGMAAEVQLQDSGYYHFFYIDDREAGAHPTMHAGTDPLKTLYTGIYIYGLPAPHDAEDYAAYQNFLREHNYKTDEEEEDEGESIYDSINERELPPDHPDYEQGLSTHDPTS